MWRLKVEVLTSGWQKSQKWKKNKIENKSLKKCEHSIPNTKKRQ